MSAVAIHTDIERPFTVADVGETPDDGCLSPAALVAGLEP